MGLAFWVVGCAPTPRLLWGSSCPVFFLMAADTSKRINCVKVCFTDREFIDLGRIAARDNRKVADLVWVEIRRRMYGTVGAELQAEEGTTSDE